MELECCDNCGEILTQVELKAKHEANESEWCCWECFGDDDEEFTEHGKYIILLNFVKSIRLPEFIWKNPDLLIAANKLLELIGEE